MKLSGTTLRAILIAMLLLVPLAGHANVAAQKQAVDPASHTSELSGLEIEVAGPEYQIVSAELQHYPSGKGEVLEIEPVSGLAYIEVAFYDDTDNPEDTVDVYLSSLENAADNFTVVDSGNDGDRSYAIASLDYDGFDFIFYVQVTEDVVGNVDQLESFLAADNFFESMLLTGQEEVQIDGVGFLSSVDSAEILEVVESGGAMPEASAPEASPEVPAEGLELPSSGTTVSLGEGLEFSGDVESGTAVESVQFEGEGIRSMIAVGETGATPVEVLDDYHAGLIRANPNIETIHREESDTSAIRLLWVPGSNGKDSVMLLVADTTTVLGFETLQAHELPADSVGDSILLLQEHVAVNGDPVLQQVDDNEMDIIAADFLKVGDSTTDPEVESMPTEERGDEGNPRNDARLPTDGTNTTDENSSEVNNNPEESPEAGDSTDTTLSLTETSWEGGVFGHLVDWDGTSWYYDSSHEGDLYSNFDEGQDTIILHSANSVDLSYLFVSVYSTEDSTPRDYLDYWQSDEFRESFEEGESGTDMQILGTQSNPERSAVVFSYVNRDGVEFIGVREAFALDDGQILVTTMLVERDSASALFEDASAVEIDGESLFSSISQSRFERLIGE